MGNTTTLGAALIGLAGIFLGAFTLPMKFATRWPWEATWLVYSLSALLLFPVAVGIATLPSISAIYLHASTASLVSTALFGFGWGVGSVLFGIGVSRLGMSLGFSIILGLTAALGSLIPLLFLSPGELLTRKGALILMGLCVVIVGIYLCGVASGMKEEAPAQSLTGAPAGSLRTGLVICVLSGVLASMLNLAMAFGQDIARSAIQLGATRASASNAIWMLAVAFGAIANAGYCLWLLRRNRTGRLLGAPESLRYWALGILMGALWYGGVTIYGSGAADLGGWGAILGWPCLMAIMIVTANVLGWITGEWRGASAKAQRTMIAAVAVLGIGVCVIGYSGAVAP